MRRLIFASVLFLGVLPVASVDASAAKAFKNCTELRKKYPKGVALTASAASKTGAALLPAVYRANSKMDRDKDKAACES